MEFRACAAGSSADDTRRGIAAPRAGEFNPKHACCAANRASTTHTDRAELSACSHSPAEVSAIPALVTSSTRRRSNASAMLPPSSAKTTSGTNATAPLRPTIADEPESLKSCTGTATAVSWLPTEVTTVDPNSRRYAGCRNGRTSITSRRQRLTALGEEPPTPPPLVAACQRLTVPRDES